MKTTNGPLRGHGDADDQNHRDSQRIMCWVIAGSLVLGIGLVFAHIFSK